jgi:hypothetical protein
MRTQWLLTENRVLPQEVLVITFTRNAATTLQHRVSRRVQESAEADLGDVSKLDIGTFHSAAAKLQSEEAKDPFVHVDETLVHFLRSIEQGEIRSFKHVIVDEFQDLDTLQCNVLAALCQQGAKLFVVGDPNQLIFGFRGSHTDIMNRVIQELNCNIIFLDANFRSTPEIVALANACAAKNNQAAGLESAAGSWRAAMPPMRAMSNIGDEYVGFRKPLVVDCDSFDSEMRVVIKEIKRLVNSHQPFAKPVAYHDIVLLFRNNILMASAQAALFGAGIPCALSSEKSGIKQGRVQLMTIHGAKGLEFLAVFVLGLCGKWFPALRGTTSLSEERNLFYVAITRARRYLTILHSSRDPSLFIAELEPPDGILEEWLFNRCASNGGLRRHLVITDPKTAKLCTPGSAAEVLRRIFVSHRAANQTEPETRLGKKIDALNGPDYVKLKDEFMIAGWRTQVLQQLGQNGQNFGDVSEIGFQLPSWADDLKQEVVELFHLVFQLITCTALHRACAFPKLKNYLDGKKPHFVTVQLTKDTKQAYNSFLKLNNFFNLNNTNGQREWVVWLEVLWKLTKYMAVYGGSKMSLQIQVTAEQLADFVPYIVHLESFFANLAKYHLEPFQANVSFGTKLQTDIFGVLGNTLCLCGPVTFPSPNDSLVSDLVRAHASVALWRVSSKAPIERVFLFNILRPHWLVLELTDWPRDVSDKMLTFLANKGAANERKRKR